MNKKIVILVSFLLGFFSASLGLAAENLFQHIILGDKPTRYSISEKNLGTVHITAQGEDSASGLYSLDSKAFLPGFPVFEWSWRVEDIHESADIRIKDKEDFAASIQLVFGKKSLFSRPKVLTYAWVGNDAPVGSIIHSPRTPGYFRTMILANAQTSRADWQKNSRNVLEDYKAAFGAYPSKELRTMGVFTDNDQTMEPVTAHYILQR